MSNAPTTEAERLVREGKAANYDLTDPANPKIKSNEDGNWQPVPAAK